jgi:STE24 endopeptidase
MSVGRRWLPAVCFTLLFSCLVPRFCPGQQAAAQLATAQPAPAQPATQAYTLPPDKLAKAIAINRIWNTLDIVDGLWAIAFLWILLATRTAARLEVWTHRVHARPSVEGLLFFAVFFILLALANLPLDVFAHQVSRSYGISIQGWASWLGNQGKALGLTVLFGAPVLLLFNWVVRRWPRRYWFGAWLITLPLIALSVFVAPLFEPIFNQYEPLARNHSALVGKLETVVARTGTNIPAGRMFLMIASAKTNGLNAYVDGIGATRRIVVWDTTAGRIPDDEVMFIFGHESGHYVLNHIPKQIMGMAIALFFVYWSCAAFATWLARRYGASWGLQPAQRLGAPSFRSPIAEGWETTNSAPLLSQNSAASATSVNPLATRSGFLVLVFAITIAGFILEPAANTFSRHFEHQADIYGQEAIHGLVPDPQKTAVASFQALGEAWLEDPNPSPLIEFWEYNHPSVKSRVNFAANYNPWANGGHGEFFDK